MEAAVLQKLSEMCALDIANCIWGFSKMSHQRRAAGCQAKRGGPRGSSCVCVGGEDEGLWDIFAASIVVFLSQISCSAFVLCVEGFWTAGYANEDVWVVLREASLRLIPRMSDSDALYIGDVFATMGGFCMETAL